MVRIAIKDFPGKLCFMRSEHAAVAHWKGGFDEAGLQSWAEELRAGLPAAKVDFGLVFLAPRFFDHATGLLELLRVHARIPLLAGCSSSGLIAGADEIEENPGLVLGLFSLPDAELSGHHFTQAEVEASDGPAFWHFKTGVRPEQSNGWLVFADPSHLQADQWLKEWNEAYPGLPILGGLAGGDFSEQRTQVYLNGEVFEEGAVAVSFGGNVKLGSVISQGCTPIGETWTITKVDGNLIYEVGNRPAYDVLIETVSNLSEEEQKKARGNLFVGLVVNEYLEEFHRGDFLIRNLLGADPQSGVLAVRALPRQGQTLQFQRRDAHAASEDMEALLERAGHLAGATEVYGGCLCCCNGRGSRLFGTPNHDAALVQKQLGPMGLAGFFCNGELGPVGERNFIHCYTAALALFLKKTPN
jgi:small ligand-binding sensory domain FIST